MTEDRVDQFICESARGQRICRAIHDIFSAIAEHIHDGDTAATRALNAHDHATYGAEKNNWETVQSELTFLFEEGVGAYPILTELKIARDRILELAGELNPLVCKLEKKINHLCEICGVECPDDHS